MSDPVSRVCGYGFAALTLPGLRMPMALPSAIGPDADLIRLASDVLTLNDQIAQRSDEQDELPYAERESFGERHITPKITRSWALRRKLRGMRASTPEGVRALLMVVMAYSDARDHDSVEPTTWALLDSLAALLGDA